MLLSGIAAAAAFCGRRERERPPARRAYKMKSVLPRETSPEQYQQGEQLEL